MHIFNIIVFFMFTEPAVFITCIQTRKNLTPEASPKSDRRQTATRSAVLNDTHTKIKA